MLIRCSMVEIVPLHQFVYVILAIDVNEAESVIAVVRSAEDAKRYCIKWVMDCEYLDVWVEKHSLR